MRIYEGIEDPNSARDEADMNLEPSSWVWEPLVRWGPFEFRAEASRCSLILLDQRPAWDESKIGALSTKVEGIEVIVDDVDGMLVAVASEIAFVVDGCDLIGMRLDAVDELVSAEPTVESMIEGVSHDYASVGLEVLDFDGDGRVDLVVAYNLDDPGT